MTRVVSNYWDQYIEIEVDGVYISLHEWAYSIGWLRLDSLVRLALEKGNVRMEDPVLIRQFNPAVKGEENFILSTWLRDLHDSDPSGLPNELWYKAHEAHIRNVLSDAKSVVLIAADREHPEEILGYVVGYPKECLEWVMIRRNLRGQKLARRLLTEAGLLPGLPSRFMTKLGRLALRNPCRSRAIRLSHSTTST